MFADLKTATRIVASFGKIETSDQNVWRFGKLSKNRRQNSQNHLRERVAFNPILAKQTVG